MFCEGQLLPICGERNALSTDRDNLRRRRSKHLRSPDLRGRIPIHQGNGFILAETGGAEEITLTVHRSRLTAIRSSPRGTQGTRSIRRAECSGVPSTATPYIAALPTCQLWHRWPSVPVGGSQPHTNFSPICVSISLFRCLGFFRRQHKKRLLGQG